MDPGISGPVAMLVFGKAEGPGCAAPASLPYTVDRQGPCPPSIPHGFNSTRIIHTRSALGSARFLGCASATRSTAPGGLLLISILATAFDSLRACGSSVRKIETIRSITEGSTRTPEHQRVSCLRQPKKQLEEAAPGEGKLKRSHTKPHTMALCEAA
jgi:hypothetical protein